MKTKIHNILKETLTSNYDNGNIEDGGIGGGDDAVDKLHELFKTESIMGMKEIIDELNKKFNDHANLVRDYQEVMDKMARLEFENKSVVIDEFRKKRNAADEKMKEYHQAVIALRKVCTHMLPNNFCAFVSAGQTDEYTIEVCSICGTELRRKL